MRVISAESIFKLGLIHADSEDAAAALKLRTVLKPNEFTRLDALAELLFMTVAPDESPASPSLDVDGRGCSASQGPGAAAKMSNAIAIRARRRAQAAPLSAREATKLQPVSQAKYAADDAPVKCVSIVSKRYESSSTYWYGYHPHWDTFLDAERSFVILGCLDRNESFALPVSELRNILPDLHRSETASGGHWHIYLYEDGGALRLKSRSGAMIDLSEYRLFLTD